MDGIGRLLGSLEGLGYPKRSDAPKEGRARIVNFAKRGHAAYSKVIEILREIERDWTEELGPRDFARLKLLLGRVWDSSLVR